MLDGFFSSVVIYLDLTGLIWLPPSTVRLICIFGALALWCYINLCICCFSLCLLYLITYVSF